MIHFIRLREYAVSYHYNNDSNKIGDFSNYYCEIDNSWYKYRRYHNSWYKYRRYRGEYVYSKKPHWETSNGIKQWHYNNWYDSYEEYMMAVVMG